MPSTVPLIGSNTTCTPPETAFPRFTKGSSQLLIHPKFCRLPTCETFLLSMVPRIKYTYYLEPCLRSATDDFYLGIDLIQQQSCPVGNYATCSFRHLPVAFCVSYQMTD